MGTLKKIIALATMKLFTVAVTVAATALTIAMPAKADLAYLEFYMVGKIGDITNATICTQDIDTGRSDFSCITRMARNDERIPGSETTYRFTYEDLSNAIDYARSSDDSMLCVAIVEPNQPEDTNYIGCY